MLVASALGSLGLDASPAQAQTPPASARRDPGSTSPPARPSAGLQPDVCLSITEPQTYRGLTVGGSLGSETLLPLGLPDNLARPPLLLGAQGRLFLGWSRSESFSLRVGPLVSFVASSRGSMMPVGGLIEPVFSPFSGFIWSIAVGGGYLLVPFSYEPKTGEWQPGPSPFVTASFSPFGFRFGDRNQGELGLRFGVIASRAGDAGQRHWDLAMGTAGGWLSYSFAP